MTLGQIRAVEKFGYVKRLNHISLYRIVSFFLLCVFVKNSVNYNL